MTLSIIIPVYNERNTIRRVIERVVHVPSDKQVIVVDDASTDGTREIEFLRRKELAQGTLGISAMMAECTILAPECRRAGGNPMDRTASRFQEKAHAPHDVTHRLIWNMLQNI